MRALDLLVITSAEESFSLVAAEAMGPACRSSRPTWAASQSRSSTASPAFSSRRTTTSAWSTPLCNCCATRLDGRRSAWQAARASSSALPRYPGPGDRSDVRRHRGRASVSAARAVRAAWLAWGIMLAVMAALVVLGSDRTVTPYYWQAGARWLAGQAALWNQGYGFIYPPHAAITFAPFALLPLTIADLFWRLVTIATYALGVRHLARLAGQGSPVELFFDGDRDLFSRRIGRRSQWASHVAGHGHDGLRGPGARQPAMDPGRRVAGGVRRHQAAGRGAAGRGRRALSADAPTIARGDRARGDRAVCGAASDLRAGSVPLRGPRW